jgi:hypothetical protein
LERLAQSRKAAPLQQEPTIEETVRAIDWDAPTPGPLVRQADAESKPAPADSSDVKEGDILFLSDKGKAGEFSLTLRVLASDELASWVVVGNEMNIDSLASTLKLSDSQKARIAGLMEWRRWALDMMTDAQKGDAEGMKKFEESFNEAVRMELDQEQAQAYQKMKSSRVQLLEYRGAAQVALEQVYSDSTRTWVKTQQKQYKKSVK